MDTLIPGAGVPNRVPRETSKPMKVVPEWLTVVDHIVDRLPDASRKIGATRFPGGHVLVLWVIVAALAVGFVAHVVGDGTVKAKADRTEELVEWLVRRAIAEDAGKEPPPYPVL